jgi:hypothetical protein
MSGSTVGKLNLAGAFAGERLFLIGNGPSLIDTPLDLLDEEYTMAMNQIDLIYDKVSWRPDFYIDLNYGGTLRDSLDAHIQMDDVTVFAHESFSKCVNSRKNIHFITIEGALFTLKNLSFAEIQNRDIEWLEQFWSYDPRESVYGFHSMYKAVQLALWMGFEEIYMLGADLGMGTNSYMIIKNDIDPFDYAGNAIMYFKQAWEVGKLSSAIVNGSALKFMNFLMRFGSLMKFTEYSTQHFYSKKSDKVRSSDIDAQLRKSHLIIKRICESNGVDVYNATLGGELEVYPRVDLRRLLD